MVSPEFRIRGTRKMRKMSGVEVANRLGISPQYYYDIEKGKKKLSADKAIQLAAIFDVTLEFLLGQPHNPDNLLLNSDLYADGYTDEDVLSDLEKKLEQSILTKDERDIAYDLELMISALESDESLAFHGEPMDDETKELMKISLENSLRLAKQMAKQKFNPNKNK